MLSNLDLNVDANTLATIVNCNPEKITSLKMNWSSVNAIPDMRNLTKLTKLELNYCGQISDLTPIEELSQLTELSLVQTNLHGRMLNFSKLTNLKELNLNNNTLWSEDLAKLNSLKNIKDLNIHLSNNSIIDATSLIALDPSCKIDLRNNINLSQESKDILKNHFGNNVTF